MKLTVILLLVSFPAMAAVHYVDLNCTNATSPFTNWTIAATNIQDAIDAAADGDLVMVTNGVYSTGGRVVFGALTNRVVVDKSVTIKSVNGPKVTVIRGYQWPFTGDSAVRCVYLTNGASIMGFTLTGGSTRAFRNYLETSGGGIFCGSVETCIVSNCIIVNNAADGFGGGAMWGTLLDSAIMSNTVAYEGGGVYGSYASKCSLVGNTSSHYPNGGVGGAGMDALLNRCLVKGNHSGDNGGGLYNCRATAASSSRTHQARLVEVLIGEMRLIAQSSATAQIPITAGEVVLKQIFIIVSCITT